MSDLVAEIPEIKPKTNQDGPFLGLGVDDCLKAFLEGFRPPEDIDVATWSDSFRVLPKVSSSESGIWSTDRTPYTREIMECLSPSHSCKEVAFCKPSQIGGTEVLINAMFASIDIAPGPMLIVQPSERMADRFVKQRINPSIEMMPRIRNKIGSKSGRGDGNSNKEKEYPGGMLLMGWSNSASNLRSMPIRYLFLDEIDNYVEDCEGEGDPVELAVARTENFPNRKIFYNSTPNLLETSRIYAKYEEGDQRVYQVPCSECGAHFEMRWENVKWDKDSKGKHQPKTAYIECPHCKDKISEYKKTEMMAAGEWVPMNPAGDFPSFRLNALYSPLGWYSWEKMVRDFLKAKRKGAAFLKVWTNTKLGEPWEESGTSVEYSGLMARRETYPEQVPDGGLILTVGADTQDDRIEAEVVSWGKDYENWSIETKTFWGDTSTAAPWAQFDAWLQKPYQHENGTKMYVAAACIDAMGHRTEEVYNWCAPRESRRIFPIQGNGGQGKPIIGKASRRHRTGVHLFPIGVDTCKEQLISSLLQEEPGPNYCHFPIADGYDQEFFEQITAERRVIRYVNGRPQFKWVKKRARNEAMDNRNYARGALEITGADLDALALMGPYLASPAGNQTNKARRVRSKGVQN